MRLAILTDAADDHPAASTTGHIPVLVDILHNLGYHPERFDATQYSATPSGISGPGLASTTPKGICLVRIYTGGTWPAEVADALEVAGWVCLDPGHRVRATADKYLAFRRFTSAGLPIIPSVLVSAHSQLPAPWPYPVVIKARHGSGGRQVARALDTESYHAALVRLGAPVDDGLVVQPYWGAPLQHTGPSNSGTWDDAAPASDLRVHVVNGHAPLVIARTPAVGQWKTNMSGGSHSEIVYDAASGLTPSRYSDARELAVRAARATQLSWTAVDLLRGLDGHLAICEANPSPGIAATVALGGLAAVTAIVARQLAAAQATSR